MSILICFIFFFSQIIEKKSKHKKHLVDNGDNHSKGINLFNGSTKLLNFVSIDEVANPTKRKRLDQNTSDKLILQRASEMAVSPEWIMNKDAVQGWAKVTKGKIIKVKSNKDGTFDVTNDEM